MLERMIFENRNIVSAETAETENSGKAVVQLFCSALLCDSPKNRRSIPGFSPLQIRFPPLLSVSPLVFFFFFLFPSLFLFACVLFIVFFLFFSALNRKVLSHYYRKRAPKKQVDCVSCFLCVHEKKNIIKQSRNYV